MGKVSFTSKLVMLLILWYYVLILEMLVKHAFFQQ